MLHSFIQVVKVDNLLSHTIVLNTGAPQGCVLSPFLYILYTNDYQSPFTTIHYFKYADDTAILALLKNNGNDSFLDYQRAITYFSTCVMTIFLHLNISKTKELVFSSYKTQIHSSIDINGEKVERVEHFRYLGITLDDNLSFNQHILFKYINILKSVSGRKLYFTSHAFFFMSVAASSKWPRERPDYFELEGNGNVFCKLCNVKLAYNNFTGAMRNHIQYRHVCVSLEASQSQMSIMSYTTTCRCGPRSFPRCLFL